jgi:hypothetical protein
MANTAKLVLACDPLKKERAWFCNINDQPEGKNCHWIPYSSIKDWNPATKEIKIEIWMLKQKGIKFKV